MQNDPLVEWQRLSEVYRGMYDDELLNLAADSKDLTETARQVLDAEMKKRGLALPQSSNSMLEPMRERRAALRTDAEAPPKLAPDSIDSDGAPEDEPDEPYEYTWKTELCECESAEQAQQIAQVLRQAGIDSWIEHPGTSSRYTGGWEYSNPRILVAADQLEQARQIAAQPVPKEIVERSKETIPEFQSPLCPKCGAADPTLEGVDPFNTWRCESCGNEWTDSAEDLAGSPEGTQA